MKAETQNVDFDPLSFGEVLESSRFMLTMKMPFGTPKCHANSGTKRDFSSHQPSRLIPEFCDVFYSSHQCFWMRTQLWFQLPWKFSRENNGLIIRWTKSDSWLSKWALSVSQKSSKTVTYNLLKTALFCVTFRGPKSHLHSTVVIQ